MDCDPGNGYYEPIVKASINGVTEYAKMMFPNMFACLVTPCMLAMAIVTPIMPRARFLPTENLQTSSKQKKDRTFQYLAQLLYLHKSGDFVFI